MRYLRTNLPSRLTARSCGSFEEERRNSAVSANPESMRSTHWEREHGRFLSIILHKRTRDDRLAGKK